MLARHMNLALAEMLQLHRLVKEACPLLVILLSKMLPATHREDMPKTRLLFNKVKRLCMEDKTREQLEGINHQGHNIPHNHNNNNNNSSSSSLASQA